jgi:hypothetical protein
MADVSSLLWSVNCRYATHYNARHERINHLFGRRFHCSPVADERGAQAVSVYVALNPVRAGFCELPGEWPYGSYAVYAGDAAAPPYLTTEFIGGLFGPGRTLADACADELGVRTPGRPPLGTFLPPRADLTRVHVRQAIAIFGYTDEELARYYGVSVRTLYRWIAG